MPITTLTPDAANASKAAALLAAQVRKDLIAAGFTSNDNLLDMTGQITAALVTAASSGSATLSSIPGKLGR